MQHVIAKTNYPLRFTSTITSKGQITLPLPIHQHLQHTKKVDLTIDADGIIRLAKAKYPTLESLAGSIPALTSPVSIQEMHKIVENEVVDQYLAKHGK